MRWPSEETRSDTGKGSPLVSGRALGTRLIIFQMDFMENAAAKGVDLGV